MSHDPRHVLADAPMSRLQVLVIAVTVGLNALDGFDVLSISFASPGIAAEWGIDRAVLGVVLAMELVGMAIGSLVLGGVADRIGRRPTTVICLGVMAVGMLMATTVRGLGDLSAWRLVTGLGIGGVLASISAIAAEFSNTRRRDLSVSLMAIGYPVGAVLGGLVAAQLLEVYSWRAVFYFGAAATAAFIPIVLLVVPESVPWLVRTQPKGALDTVNRTLRRFGREPVSTLPPTAPKARKLPLAALFTPDLSRTTTLATVAYFCHVLTFYFVIKWIPKIVVDMGFPASAAAGVLVWANVGGAAGGALLGVLTQRVSVRTLTIVGMVASTAMVILFGRTPADLQQLSLACAVAGFFTNGSIVGIYAIFAKAFPTPVRATGTGFVIGVGRGGAALAPALAGVFFAAGATLPTVSMAMSLGSLLAAAALFFLPLERRSDGQL